MIYNLRRVDWIRTSDPLHPMQIRYRAAPPPETGSLIMNAFYKTSDFRRVANVKAFYKNQPILRQIL